MKRKLTLKSFEVKSFVTAVDNETSETMKGGVPGPNASWKWCQQSANPCPHSDQALCTGYGGGCNTEGDCNSDSPYCVQPDPGTTRY